MTFNQLEKEQQARRYLENLFGDEIDFSLVVEYYPNDDNEPSEISLTHNAPDGLMSDIQKACEYLAEYPDLAKVVINLVRCFK